ncbi:hypothetical protein TNCT_594401 [Trichonephila clavata]|uniref:Uncharacterized protein n=1 Tax=Trichonephila clavata TaxID=2740835 RepID=A0A8X6HRE3_TRICU|nr:hypothetical protein TNCT_594401 [Trichonephila clavata]
MLRRVEESKRFEEISQRKSRDLIELKLRFREKKGKKIEMLRVLFANGNEKLRLAQMQLSYRKQFLFSQKIEVSREGLVEANQEIQSREGQREQTGKADLRQTKARNRRASTKGQERRKRKSAPFVKKHKKKEKENTQLQEAKILLRTKATAFDI